MISSVIVVIIITLLFSAFFSGMEIAFVASNKLKLEIRKKQNKTFNYIADIFLKRPGQYITTLLVGNNIALVTYSLQMSILLTLIGKKYGIAIFAEGSVLLETLISTVIIIFASEFIPKAIFRSSPNFYMRIFAVPVFIIYLILYPIARFSTWLSVLILKIFGLPVDQKHTIKSFDKVDLAHLLEESDEGEEEQDGEREMKLFRNALDFSDLRVRDCMVPRVDIEAIEINDTIANLSKLFIDTNFSRIFVYEGSIDNIVGYVNTKTLFQEPTTIREILMGIDYVPESLSAQKLLSMLIKRSGAIAVVIDEFGGTAGMVSMEDILEEIFGEIEDEHDEQDLVERVVDDSSYIFSCRLEVDYLNEKYGLKIPESDEYDTLAGYIIYYHEGIPSQGEVIVIGNKEIYILRMSGSKLDLARVKLLL